MNPSPGPMAVGTWAWGDRTGWGAQPDEQELEKAFTASLRAGINLFDTAERYGAGESELILGRCIARTRDPVRIATKFSPLRSQWRPRHLRSALEGSLKRLGVGRIDLYQIHWPTRFSSIGIWMDALADAASDGLIDGAGVANYSPDQVRTAFDLLARRGLRLASVQVQFSLIHRVPERNGMFALCRELGLTLLAYSPLAMGVLSGKYDSGALPGGENRRSFTRERLDALRPLTALLREIGRGHGKTPSQVALSWVIAKGAVPIAGARSGAQAEENAGALGWRLGEEEIRALEEQAERTPGGTN
ncbi:MAG TPA: aldo/keto reductase [Bacteroidota bacterium]|nr:aldo/keto reductase [Bacteroidota bacterium]